MGSGLPEQCGQKSKRDRSGAGGKGGSWQRHGGSSWEQAKSDSGRDRGPGERGNEAVARPWGHCIVTVAVWGQGKGRPGRGQQEHGQGEHQDVQGTSGQPLSRASMQQRARPRGDRIRRPGPLQAAPG
jgi:hypothetical protein